MRDPDENLPTEIDEEPGEEIETPDPSMDEDGPVDGEETPRRRRKRVDTLNDLPAVDVAVDEEEEPTERMSVVSGRIQVIGDASVVVTERAPEPEDSVIIDEPPREAEPSVIIDEPPREAVPSVIIDEPEEDVRRDTDSYETMDDVEIVDEVEEAEESTEEIEAVEEEEEAAVEEEEEAAVEEVEVEEEEEAAVEEAEEEVQALEPEEDVVPLEADEAFSSVPPVTKKTTSTPPPFTKKQVESVPPPPPPAQVSSKQVDVGEDVAPQVLAIPEDDVKRDYKVAVEREALESAAIEVIPPEFMVEEDDRPKPPRPRPKRPRRPRKWYEEIFGDEYLMNEPKLSDFQYRREIDFVEKMLGLRPGAMVLDLACGSGVHAIGMSKRGYQVVGLDYSVAMLAIAGEEAQEHDIKINFLHGDMRDLQFGPTFDGAYCIGTSFGYFDEETNHKVIQGIRRALKPGGVLLLEVDNRDFVMRDQPNLLWYEGDGFICMEETSFDFISSRLTVNRTMLLDEGGKKVSKYSIRVYSLHELGTILHKEGFSVNTVGGHRAAPLAFLGEESPKIILTARKKAEEG